MMIFSLILAVVFSIVAVIFALGNPGIVSVSFLSWNIEGSLALILLSSVAIGILIGILLMTPGAVKRNLALSGQKKKLKSAEQELDQQKSKLTELEDKVKQKEAKQVQVTDEINQRLDTL